MKAIVLGGTKGLGKAVADNLKNVCDEIVAVGSKDIDTSSLESVRNFTKKHSDRCFSFKYRRTSRFKI